jgi:hypothetical protein
LQTTQAQKSQTPVKSNKGYLQFNSNVFNICIFDFNGIFVFQEFSEVYHSEKSRAAAVMEEKKPKAIPMEVKLARSVSVQEELQTPN